jgi:hypothetical protein
MDVLERVEDPRVLLVCTTSVYDHLKEFPLCVVHPEVDLAQLILLGWSISA